MANPLKAESIFHTIGAFVQFGLSILGIVGFTLDLFNDNGLPRKLLGHLISSRVGLAAIPVMLLVLYIFNKILSAPTNDRENFIGNLPLYVIMTLGVYYLFHFVQKGGF